MISAKPVARFAPRIATRWRGFGTWVGQKVNGLSELVAGRDRRFRYGADGLTRLPPLVSDSLVLTSSTKRQLANSRVYLLNGMPWPGIAKNGGAWMDPWASKLEELGVGHAKALHYNGSSSLVANLRALLEPFFHFDERRVMKMIQADLAARPLKAGERVFLLGHSYGNILAMPLSERLKAQGVPLQGVVLIEDRVPPPFGQLVKKAPKVKQVLEIENNPGKPLITATGTDYRRQVAPELTHMDFVLNPPARILEAVVKELAR